MPKTKSAELRITLRTRTSSHSNRGGTSWWEAVRWRRRLRLRSTEYWRFTWESRTSRRFSSRKWVEENEEVEADVGLQNIESTPMKQYFLKKQLPPYIYDGNCFISPFLPPPLPGIRFPGLDDVQEVLKDLDGSFKAFTDNLKQLFLPTAPCKKPPVSERSSVGP